MTQQTETFPEESFAKLAAVEDGHFWFEERNNLIFGGYEKVCARVAAAKATSISPR
jgi:hypothetical protein